MAISRISAEQLASLLRPAASSVPNSSILIVDVRDDDYEGGHIPDALNIPSNLFYRSFHKIDAAAKGKQQIIFHCMKSQMRGPTAANQYIQHLARRASDNQAADQQTPTVYVLTDGFEGWLKYVISVHKSSASANTFQIQTLIEEYEEKIWGHKFNRATTAPVDQ